MPRVITILLYKFDELSEEQKSLAVEAYRKIEQREGSISNNIDLEQLESYFKRRLIEEGFPEDMEVPYSLDYSQGDGVTFNLVRNLDSDEILNILEKIVINPKINRYKQVFSTLNICELEIKHASRYYHINSFDVRYDYTFKSSYEKKMARNDILVTIPLLRRIEILIKNRLIGLSAEFEKYGYDFIEQDKSLCEITNIFLDEGLEVEFTDDTKNEVKKIWGI